MNLPEILVLLLLGAKAELYFLWFMYTSMIGVFQHSNLKINAGILNWFFSLTELHRWHHSTVSSESNHNYGQNIILWDVIFGTRYLPKDRDQPEEIGMSYPKPFPATFIAQLLAPIQWKKIDRPNST